MGRRRAALVRDVCVCWVSVWIGHLITHICTVAFIALHGPRCLGVVHFSK